MARVLASMHLKGYTHNDLHSGNVLRNTAAVSSKFSVIDMGATCKACGAARVHEMNSGSS